MFGTKYSMVDTDSDLRSFEQNTDGGFIFDNNQSNRFLVDENIIALYTKFTSLFGKWSFSGGLRWENSHTKGTSINTSATDNRVRNIPNFFLVQVLIEK